MELTKLRLQFDEIIGYNNREFNNILWAWIKRNASNISNLVEAEIKPAACGQELLKAMMELKYDPDKDMMPTVKRVEKANGGFTTYFRHDAVVKYCNEHFISKPSV